MDPSEAVADSDPDPDSFSDALDALPPSDAREAVGSPSPIPPAAPADPEESPTAASDPPPPPSSLRRRRPTRIPAVTSNVDSPRERRSKILRALKEGAQRDRAGDSSSTLTSLQIRNGNDRLPEVSIASSPTSVPREAEPPSVDSGAPASSLLESMAGFVIKSVLFQVNLMISCVAFPFWFLHCTFLLVTDPFRTLMRAIDGMRTKVSSLWKVLFEKTGALVHEKLGIEQGAGRVLVRLIWGCFWSFYVCFVLFGLLASAFLGGSLLVGRVVEEPIQIEEELNFDYTKASPEDLVPKASCGGFSGLGLKSSRIGGQIDGGLVPPNHKLQLTVSLTLPESDYNRKLGVFQVTAEFLSSTGRVMSSSSQPCMLRFKSSYMRLIEAFLKSGPLLTGYSLESQVIRINMRGLIQGTDPIMCIRIILKQRAEFVPGAGIPEIYAASLKLESELPLLKRMIWSWRRTVFVWISMGIFIFELLIALVCCRPVVVPRTTLGSRSP